MLCSFIQFRHDLIEKGVLFTMDVVFFLFCLAVVRLWNRPETFSGVPVAYFLSDLKDWWRKKHILHFFEQKAADALI